MEIAGFGPGLVEHFERRLLNAGAALAPFVQRPSNPVTGAPISIHPGQPIAPPPPSATAPSIGIGVDAIGEAMAGATGSGGVPTQVVTNFYLPLTTDGSIATTGTTLLSNIISAGVWFLGFGLTFVNASGTTSVAAGLLDTTHSIQVIQTEETSVSSTAEQSVSMQYIYKVTANATIGLRAISAGAAATAKQNTVTAGAGAATVMYGLKIG